MGEYAKRISDGVEVKIGTCEDMYYLRFEDRDKVRPISGNLDPVQEANVLRFRLPFPDEDDIQIGTYKDYRRGQVLYRGNDYFSDESKAAHAGLIQLHHDSGLMVNAACFHGIKLPDGNADLRPFWNGKAPSFVLSSIGPRQCADGVFRVHPIVACRHCNEAWRYQWSDIWSYIPYALQVRLREYMESFPTVSL